jgi:hypothetical protein
MIPPPAQRFMSQRTGSIIEEVVGSHAIYVSRPDAVARDHQKGRRCREGRGDLSAWSYLGPRLNKLDRSAVHRRGTQTAVRPPSTASLTPWMKLARSVAKKTMASAISSGVAGRPAGA